MDGAAARAAITERELAADRARAAAEGFAWREGLGYVHFGRWVESGPYGTRWEDGDYRLAPDPPAELRDRIPASVWAEFDRARKSLSDGLGTSLNRTSGVGSGRSGAGAGGNGSRVAETGSISAARAEARGDIRAFAGILGWMISVLAVVGVLGAAASFIPFVGRYISFRQAASVLGFSVALVAVRYVVLVYGAVSIEVGFWVMVVALIGWGIAFGWPIAVGLYRRSVARQGEALAEEAARDGDASKAREAVALMAAGDRVIDRSRRQVASALAESDTVSVLPALGFARAERIERAALKRRNGSNHGV